MLAINTRYSPHEQFSYSITWHVPHLGRCCWYGKDINAALAFVAWLKKEGFDND